MAEIDWDNIVFCDSLRALLTRSKTSQEELKRLFKQLHKIRDRRQEIRGEIKQLREGAK